MKQIRNKFERFCFRHQNKGIPNLMLWIIIANIVVYFINVSDPHSILYYILSFDRDGILHGEVWRLFSYIFLELSYRDLIWAAISAIFYYQLGLALENAWGRLRFNLYYLTGLLFLDVAGFIFNFPVNAGTLNLTLFLAYATLYPDTHFLIFFIIPVKARWLGIFNLAVYLYELLLFHKFPYNLLPLFALANYFLYFGKSFIDIFPVSWQVNAGRLVRRKSRQAQRKTKPIMFPKAGSYDATYTNVKSPYMHKCTVCGRTDVSDPGLEFRYCSRCKGYHCYCEDHINNHTHLE